MARAGVNKVKSKKTTKRAQVKKPPAPESQKLFFVESERKMKVLLVANVVNEDCVGDPGDVREVPEEIGKKMIEDGRRSNLANPSSAPSMKSAKLRRIPRKRIKHDRCIVFAPLSMYRKSLEADRKSVTINCPRSMISGFPPPLAPLPPFAIGISTN